MIVVSSMITIGGEQRGPVEIDDERWKARVVVRLLHSTRAVRGWRRLLSRDKSESSQGSDLRNTEVAAINEGSCDLAPYAKK